MEPAVKLVDFAAELPEADRLLAAYGRRLAREQPPSDENEAQAAAALCGASAPFVGPYELLAPIGTGGVAAVFRARHVHPAFAERPTAIKVLKPDHRADERLLALFRREADVLSLIKHGNVVETYDAGVEDDTGYLAMEYVPGADLAHLLWRARQRQLTLPVPLLVYVAREVLAGLAYAHALQDLHDRPLQLVHRDVNPANVLLSYAGEVKLSDFGVASVRLGMSSRPSELAGKAGYFAPEQLAGEAVQAQGDVYALGATLYEMLTGAPLFGAGKPAEVLQRNRLGVLPEMGTTLAHVEPALVQVLRTALARRPEDRYASAAAMSDALLPHSPPAAAARVLLAALMRQLFARELRAERTAAPSAQPSRDAATQHTPNARVGEGGLPRAVDVVVAESVAAGAIAQVLGAAGYEVHAFASLDAWETERSGLHPPAPVAVVDVRLATRDAHRACAHEMLLRVRHLQVLCLAGGFELGAAEVAEGWRARELWVPPFAVERLQQGIQDAWTAAAEAADGAAVALPSRRAPRLCVLQVAATQLFVDAAAAEAAAREDLLTRVDGFASALALTDEASFDALVVQTDGQVGPLAEELTRYRAAWGMGDVPCLWSLPPHQRPSAEPLLPRSAWLPWGGRWKDALAEAYAGTVAGQARAFARYNVRVPVGLRVGGQVRNAYTLNVSRRGLLLATDHLPSVGTELMLACYLPNQQVVQVRGKALRVALPESGASAEAATQMGVALGPFVADGERVWLGWLKQVAEAEAAAVAAPASGWLGRLFSR